eukprot:scaffold480_cov257-Pinguiococcus_pyrenoidosus.AAC.26
MGRDVIFLDAVHSVPDAVNAFSARLSAASTEFDASGSGVTRLAIFLVPTRLVVVSSIVSRLCADLVLVLLLAYPRRCRAGVSPRSAADRSFGSGSGGAVMLVALAFHAGLLLLATSILWSPAPSQQGSRSSQRWLRSSLDDVAEKESTNETILRLPPGVIGKEIPAAAL